MVMEIFQITDSEFTFAHSNSPGPDTVEDVAQLNCETHIPAVIDLTFILPTGMIM